MRGQGISESHKWKSSLRVLAVTEKSQVQEQQWQRTGKGKQHDVPGSATSVWIPCRAPLPWNPADTCSAMPASSPWLLLMPLAPAQPAEGPSGASVCFRRRKAVLRSPHVAAAASIPSWCAGGSGGSRRSGRIWLLEVAVAEDWPTGIEHRAPCPASVPAESRRTWIETGWGAAHRGDTKPWPRGTTSTVPPSSGLMGSFHGPSEVTTTMMRRAWNGFCRWQISWRMKKWEMWERKPTVVEYR